MASKFKRNILPELEKEISPVTVANKIGLEVFNYGGLKIRCPLHDDSHPSCQLSRNRKFFYCYVCRRAIRPFDLLRFNGYSGEDAIDVLAELSGHYDDWVYHYDPKQRTNKPRVRFLREDEKILLGILKPRYNISQRKMEYRRGGANRYPVGCSSRKPIEGEVSRDSDGSYITWETPSGDPWVELAKEPEVFNEMVRSLCCSQYERVKQMRDYARKGNSEIHKELSVIYQEQLMKINELYKLYNDASHMAA